MSGGAPPRPRAPAAGGTASRTAVSGGFFVAYGVRLVCSLCVASGGRF